MYLVQFLSPSLRFVRFLGVRLIRILLVGFLTLERVTVRGVLAVSLQGPLVPLEKERIEARRTV